MVAKSAEGADGGDDGTAGDGSGGGIPSDDDVLRESRVQGMLRRNGWLFGSVLLALLLGPCLSRYIESYRAIVLDMREGEMLLARPNRPPSWVTSGQVDRGQLLEKRTGEWSPEVAERTPTDAELVALYDRYSKTYVGTVMEIAPPRNSTGTYTAVIQVDGDGRVGVPMFSEHLAGLMVGNRVQKLDGHWDPIIIDSGTSVQLAPGVGSPAKPPPDLSGRATFALPEDLPGAKGNPPAATPVPDAAAPPAKDPATP